MLSDKVSVVRYVPPTADGVVAASSRNAAQTQKAYRASGAPVAREAVTRQANASVAEKDKLPENVKVATDQVRHYIQQFASELDFSIDEDTEKLVVKLMDKSTGEMLRQVPTEEILHVAKMLDKLQGLLYSDHA